MSCGISGCLSESGASASNQDNSNFIAWIVGGVIGVLVLVIIALVLVFLIRRQRRKKDTLLNSRVR